jgi:predicted O-linked N-acetylglucosamine transferase (SPINDLY family)
VNFLNQGQIDLAMAVARSLADNYPRNALGWKVLGTLLSQQNQHEEGIVALKKAVKITPADHEIHCNLGIALRCLGQFEAAISSLQRAIRLNPNNAPAHNSLGLCMHDIGNFDESVKYFRKAISVLPDYVEPYSNIGITLQDQGELDIAIEYYNKAIAINPQFIQTYVNLGSVLIEQDQCDEAVKALNTALQINAQYVDAHYNIGNAYQNNLQYDQAIAHYRKALELKPDFHGAFNNLLFCANYHPDLSSEELYAYYPEYEEQFARSLYQEWRPHANDRDPQRRLKVGYVSPSFYNHSARHFLEPLLAHHDHSQVEVYAYAQLIGADEVTARYQSYVDHWIPTRGMSDAALAERIRADGIDILIDVAGHTGENRLLVFARKPAPVSLHWLDFGYTTGLTAIDYYLTDAPTTPPGSEAYFAEQIWRLPTPAYAYRPMEGMGEVGPLPAKRKGHITFGTLTRAVRLNYKLIRTWSQLLKAVPGSHLIINSGNFKSAAMQERVAEQFMAHGVAREQLEIGSSSPPWDVLRNIDIGLDCFPHNSGTTLFENLYMGIPFVTLSSRPSVGYLGASILHGVGHPEWIAENEEEYIAKAVGLAQDLPALAELRSTLRQQMQQSPLMDEVGFTRAVEQAYRQMWQQWCAQPPQ